MLLTAVVYGACVNGDSSSQREMAKLHHLHNRSETFQPIGSEKIKRGFMGLITRCIQSDSAD